jgi:hypothetical protein
MISLILKLLVLFILFLSPNAFVVIFRYLFLSAAETLHWQAGGIGVTRYKNHDALPIRRGTAAGRPGSGIFRAYISENSLNSYRTGIAG